MFIIPVVTDSVSKQFAASSGKPSATNEAEIDAWHGPASH